MKRLLYITNHPEYQNAYRQIQDAEKERAFCLHDTGHFLAVSRIAYILVLEERLGVKKDVIYAAGFCTISEGESSMQRGFPMRKQALGSPRIFCLSPHIPQRSGTPFCFY